MIAAADQVTIANKALAMLGKKPLTDFNDTGDVAKHCDALMPELVYELIDEHDWSFLKIGSAELVETTAPTFGYDNAFTLPAGIYIVNKVLDGDSESEYPWRVVRKADGTGYVLETDQDDDVYIEYSYVAGTTMTNWRYSFWKVIRLRLASILAIALDGDKVLSRELEERANKAYDKAVERDLVASDKGEYEDYDDKTTAWHKAGR